MINVQAGRVWARPNRITQQLQPFPVLEGRVLYFRSAEQAVGRFSPTLGRLIE